MITKDYLSKFCHDETIILTRHLTLRCSERDLSYDDIKQTILNGEIVEQYPDDYPYPSCLIAGFAVDNKHIHVVCGMGEIELHLITVYYPDIEEWTDDFKIRKEPK